MIKPLDPSFSKVGAVAPSEAVERVRGDAGGRLVAVATTAVQAPAFAIGEAVTARMVEPLRGGQWVAVIKNAVLTLQWPVAGAGAPAAPPPARGEALSLRVASLAPRLTFVLAGVPPAGTSANAAAVQLSRAARSLSDLVNAGERALPAAGLAATNTLPVLLDDPAAAPAERAHAVAQAISRSGLFYESHLLAWAEGRMPLSSLDNEPQARVAQALKNAEPADREAASAALGGVLQRQLDALDGKPLAFAGFAWPGQAAAWQVQREARAEPEDDAAGKHQTDGVQPMPVWSTQIHLQLPRLGALGAHVRVAGPQVQLALTLDERGAALLATHRERLASALQAAGLTLTGLKVQAPAAPHEQAEKP